MRAVFAFLVLPGVVAFAIPALLALTMMRTATSWFGWLVAAVGTASLVSCAVAFHRRGKGTLAPWAPPKRLVTHCLYAFSRNPMYLSVLLVLVGWAMALGSGPHAAYAVCVAIAFHWRVVAGEEPRLGHTFGVEWQTYRAAVPRWLPPLPRWPAGLCFAVGVLFGAALWLLSPTLLGQAEPWDASLPVWSLCWPAIGLVGAATRHVRGLLLPLGDAAGQVAATVPLMMRSEFGALGLVFIGGGLVVALAVTLVLLGVIALWRRYAGTTGSQA